MLVLFKCVKCGLPSKTPYCVSCGGKVELRSVKKGCSQCGQPTESKFCPRCGGHPVDIVVVKKPESYSIRPVGKSGWEAYCGNCAFKPREPEKAVKGYCVECGARNWKNRKKGGCKCQACNDFSKERYGYCGRCGGIMADFLLQQGSLQTREKS
ncbi:MAG TPA: hypothetical protein HPP54_06275 [Nitrospinae bacterium]|nr:hypothetical protein [Nitrospinota bacterium]